MVTREQLDAAKVELAQAINDATARVVATIADLKAQLAAGQPITDQDLNDLQADMGVAAKIDPVVVPPGP